MVILVATIMFCYANLPESIAITHDDAGRPDNFLDKQNFFYITAGVVLLFNFLMNILKGQLLKVNFARLNPASIWAGRKTSLDNLLAGWFDAFVALINTFLVFVLFGLNTINATKGQVLDFDFNKILIPAAFLLIFLVFFLPLRILFSNPSPGEE